MSKDKEFNQGGRKPSNIGGGAIGKKSCGKHSNDCATSKPEAAFTGRADDTTG